MSLVEYTFTDEHSVMTYNSFVDTEKFFTSSSQIMHHILNEKIHFYYIDSDGAKIYMELNKSNIKNVNKFIEIIETNILNNKIPTFILEIQHLKNCKKIEEIIEERKKYIEKYEPTWDSKNLTTPENYKAKTKQITDNYLNLKSIKRDTELKSFECLKTNWIEIKQHLLNQENKSEKLKLQIKEAKARYYQKQKAEKLNKPQLTEEQAEKYKEQVAKANKKYYEKKKSKLLELGVTRPIQTEEEKILARKEANKRYYENRKLRNKEI